MSMNVWVLPSFFSAGAALILAVFFLLKRKDGPIFFPFLYVMAVMAWIHGLNGLSQVIEGNPLHWKKLIVLGELGLPVMVCSVTHSLVKYYSHNSGTLWSGWWRMMACGAAIFGMLVMGIPDEFLQTNLEGDIVVTRPVGWTLWGFILGALFIGVFQLEQILRSFKDPLRYNLKYVLIGLGGLACISIAQAIHMLLVPVWRQDFVWAGGMASFSSLLVMGFGLGRWRLQGVSQKFQMSHQALYTSLTVVFVGGYFVLVGTLAAVIQQTDWVVKEALGVVLVFLAGLLLVVGMCSRHIRGEFQQLISRHFLRNKYDYREIWFEATETFSACKDIPQIWNQYLEWLSRTFGTSRITIWKQFVVDGRYHQIRRERRRRKWTDHESMTSPDPLPIPESHPIILHLKEHQEPVVIPEHSRDREDWNEFFPTAQTHVCVPLLTGEERLLGFCMLSKELPDKGYDQDDIDLLRAIAHHVTMLLIQFELVEERSSSAKWEAVHRFSAFYLHDLKNLASSLSMVAQNAEQYGNNPEFQVSAMQSVKNTSQRIVDLMGKLSSQAKESDMSACIAAQVVDINMLIQETLAGVAGHGCQPTFHPGQEVPRLRLKTESVAQVLLNLILNARQATGENASIDISTAYDGQQVIIEIVDTGTGMSASQLENLFQPFHSSKKTGLGVGLFQCKRIVEDHQGKIHIESQEGRGTTVIITFPVTNADNSRDAVSGFSTTGVGMNKEY